MHSEPLAQLGDLTTPDEIALSTGGCVCLVAYWVFSSTIFDASRPQPEMHIFPEHFAVLDKFLQDDAQAQIQNSVGTIEALLAIGLWLQSNNLISAHPTSPLTNPTTSPEDPTSDFMRYIHMTTLIALYHPALQVRNAASVLAGLVLHSNPSDDDRLKILEDLLENCMFATLKARAVAWLREELIAASPPTSSSATTAPTTAAPSQPPQEQQPQQEQQEQQEVQQQQQQQSLFATPQALEAVQYVVFPPLASLLDLPTTQDLAEYLAANAPFLMQAVNFALFLWSSSSSSSSDENRWKHVLPANMEATVRERWFEPLREVVERVVKEEGKQGGGELGELGEGMGVLMGEVGVLRERLGRLEGVAGFRARG